MRRRSVLFRIADRLEDLLSGKYPVERFTQSLEELFTL